MPSEALRVIASSSGSQPNCRASAWRTVSTRGASTSHMWWAGSSLQNRTSRIICSSTCDGAGLTPPLLRLQSVRSVSKQRWICDQ